MQRTQGRTKQSVYLAFWMLGVSFGGYLVGYSELQRNLHLGTAELGAIISASAALALPVQFAGGPLLHMFGSRTWVATLLVNAAAGGALAFATRPWQLFVLLAIATFSRGLFNIMVNAAALDHEDATGERIMVTAHAFFALGAACGTSGAGAVLALNGGQEALFCGLGLLGLLAANMSSLVQGLERDRAADGSGKVNFFILGDRAIRTFIAITTTAAFAETVMYTWPAIYLRSNLHSTALVGALGSTAFFGAMTVGRLGSSAVQRRAGRLQLLSCAGFLTAAGIALSIGFTYLPLVIAGFLIVGAACSVMVPLAYSATGTLASAGTLARESAVVVAGVIGPINSAVGMLAPVVIGGMASFTSLRAALGCVAAAGTVVGAGTLAFRRSPLSAPITD